MTTAAPDKPQSRHRRSCLSNLLLLLVLLLLLALLAAMMLLHEPTFYARANQRREEQLTRDAAEFSRSVQDFLSAVWSEQPAPLALTDHQVNGYLAAVNDDALWQKLPIRLESWRGAFTSDVLRDVKADFRTGRVTVAGKMKVAGMNVVVSLYGVPTVDDQGRVRLHVEGVRAGLVPIPQWTVRELLAGVNDRPIPSKPGRWRVTSIAIGEGIARLEGEPEKK